MKGWDWESMVHQSGENGASVNGSFVQAGAGSEPAREEQGIAGALDRAWQQQEADGKEKQNRGRRRSEKRGAAVRGMALLLERRGSRRSVGQGGHAQYFVRDS